MKTDYIFVYGTLRRNVKNSNYKLIAKYTQFIGFGFVYGKLYNISWYPGAVLEKRGKNRVYGEIYRIKNPFYKKLLKILDNYEECSPKFPKPHEYKRVKADAFLNRRKIKVWVYEYNFDVSGLKLIKDDFMCIYGEEKVYRQL